MSIGAELLREMLTVLRRDPSLARELHELLGLEQQAGTQGAELMRSSAWAHELRVSPRLVRQWLDEGLPHIKRGRLTFIVLGQAEAWLRGQGHEATSEPSTDSIQLAARRAAAKVRRVAA